MTKLVLGQGALDLLVRAGLKSRPSPAHMNKSYALAPAYPAFNEVNSKILNDFTWIGPKMLGAEKHLVKLLSNPELAHVFLPGQGMGSPGGE